MLLSTSTQHACSHLTDPHRPTFPHPFSFSFSGLFGSSAAASGISAEIPSSRGGVIITYLKKVAVFTNGTSAESISFEFT